MSERMRESLSALMDNEADELELQRILSGIGDDVELRQTWVRYHLARAALSDHGAGIATLDISMRVQSALAQSAITLRQKVQRLLKPLASFAVAASVATVAVVGGQQLMQIGEVGTSYQAGNGVAASASAVGMVNSIGAVPVQASFGTQGVPILQPASRTAYQELARQRMQKYMQEHAEHAALNSPQGLVPFARVPVIEE